MTTGPIEAPPATTPSSPHSPVPRRAALIGGLALLVMAIVAGWANFVVIEGLTTPGDAAATARDIAASEGTFRLGVAAFAFVAILDVVVAWALYEVFHSVIRSVSAVAGWLSGPYTAPYLRLPRFNCSVPLVRCPTLWCSTASRHSRISGMPGLPSSPSISCSSGGWHGNLVELPA